MPSHRRPSPHPALAALCLLALLALVVAPTAQAFPKLCEDVCSNSTPCNTTCRAGTHYVTCFYWGVCDLGSYPQAQQASATSLETLFAEISAVDEPTADEARGPVAPPVRPAATDAAARAHTEPLTP